LGLAKNLTMVSSSGLREHLPKILPLA